MLNTLSKLVGSAPSYKINNCQRFFAINLLNAFERLRNLPVTLTAKNGHYEFNAEGNEYVVVPCPEENPNANYGLMKRSYNVKGEPVLKPVAFFNELPYYWHKAEEDNNPAPANSYKS